MSCGDRLEMELRRAGYRVTAQRAVILETIAHMDGHRSVNEVFDMAEERLPGLNLATVYRTLETMQRAGLIDLLSASGNPMRFSLRDQSNRHGHLRCRVCGSVFEIPVGHFSNLLDDIEKSYGFKVESDHLTLQGICGACDLEHATRHIEANSGRD